MIDFPESAFEKKHNGRTCKGVPSMETSSCGGGVGGGSAKWVCGCDGVTWGGLAIVGSFHGSTMVYWKS